MEDLAKQQRVLAILKKIGILFLLVSFSMGMLYLTTLTTSNHRLEYLKEYMKGQPFEIVKVEKAAKELDQFYMSSRYPDALPGGAPFEMFTEEQAQSALEKAQTLLSAAKVELEAAQ